MAVKSVSALIGWGLGVVLGNFLQIYLRPLVWHGPDSSKIRKEIYQGETGCYRLIPRAVVGPIIG